MSYIKDFYKAYDEIKANTSSSSAGASANSGGSPNNASPYMNDYKTSLQNLLTGSIDRNDIAPVYKAVTARVTVGNKKKDEEEDKLDFFQKGVFEDGWQFGDLAKTILGTAGDAGLNVVKGAGSLVEGVGDLISYGAAGVADAVGEDAWADQVRKKTQESRIDEWTQGATDFLDKYSVLGRTSDSILQGIGQVGGIMATGGLGAAAGLSSAGVTALTTGVMGLSGMGSGMGEAYQSGATDAEATIYGAISGGADALTELLFGGMGKAVNALGFSKGLSSADDMIAKAVSDKFKNQIIKNFAEFGVKASAEGLEEVLAGTAQAIGKKLTYMSEKDLSDILKDENLLEQFIVGSVTSGMIQSGIVPGTRDGSLIEANKNNSDFLTGTTQNELDLPIKEEAIQEETVAEQIEPPEVVIAENATVDEVANNPNVEDVHPVADKSEIQKLYDERDKLEEMIFEEDQLVAFDVGSPETLSELQSELDSVNSKIKDHEDLIKLYEERDSLEEMIFEEDQLVSYDIGSPEALAELQSRLDGVNRKIESYENRLNPNQTVTETENIAPVAEDAPTVEGSNGQVTLDGFANPVQEDNKPLSFLEELDQDPEIPNDLASLIRKRNALEQRIKEFRAEGYEVSDYQKLYNEWERTNDKILKIQFPQNMEMYNPDAVAPTPEVVATESTPAIEDLTESQAEVAPTLEAPAVAEQTVTETDQKPSVKTEPVVEKPKTTADKAQEHYRGDILNRGDILSKLVNSGKTTMKAVNEATKQAQALISKGAEGVKSIGEIFGRISTDGKLDKFEDYLHHLLNVDRRTMQERFGLRDRPVWDYSAEESQKRADKLAEENPEFVKAAEDVYAFNDYVMSVRVKSGKITQEQADIWKQYYPHYVPISRGGADTYKALLDFTEGDTTAFKTLDDFSNEADLAADVHKIKRSGDDFDALMDTMVNAAFTAHWGLAISDNGVTAPTAPVQTQTTVDAPVADNMVENQTEEDYVPSAEKAPSPDAVQPADHESIKLMKQEDGVKGKVLDAVHWVEDNVLDNGRVFEKIDHKKGNRNLYSHWHAIRNAFSSAQHFIGKGNSAKGVRALNDIYAEIKKKGLTSDFDSYLAHQRNIDGMTMQARYGVAANREVIKGVSAAQSYKEVLKLQNEHPQFKQWAKDIYANTGYVIDQMVEHKMLSQDMADLFKELYPHYVPMRYGKNGALESSLESMGQFIVEAFNSFAMNDFGLELKHTLRSEINREDMNIDTFIDRLDSGSSLFDFDVNGMDGDYHTYTVYENGELKTFDITREMYMAMNQTRNWMDWKIPFLYHVNEGFRKATTELNWIFAATNAVKDPQEIMWNSQHPLETYAKFLPAEVAVWSKDSKYRHYYEEYLANGGEAVEYFNPNKNTFDADKGVFAYLNQKIGTGAISNLNGRVETAPRLAEYIASREAGKSVQESMLDAAQVTVNFQAGGKLTKFLNRNGCTFLNASVQGALQHARNIQEGKQNAWKGVSALIAKGMVAGLGSELVKQINHLLWDDDDEYENLPDYIKQDYYLFGKFGDGTWLRLPKGRTNATIEEAIRQVALSSTGDDEADWDSFWKLFVENMAPNNPATNNLLAPIIEVKTNTTWYGEDLVPKRLQETRDENGEVKKIPVTQQYDEKTDSFSIWLSEQLDYVSQKYNKALTELYGYNPNVDTSTLSPKQINYLLNSYTGVIGDTLLPMGTPKAESPDDGLLGKLIAPLRDKFTTDAVLNHRATEDFYEALEAAELKAEAEDATLQDKLESGLLIGYNVELSDLYEKQREIQMDKSLTNSEKYEKTREIKKKINDLQEEALKALEGYDIDGIYAEAGDKRYNFDSENDTWWEVKPKTADGEDNWYYQQEQLYHDYLGVDYADYWNGRLNPEDYNVKSLYAERNGKRYNFDMEANSWYEIKPKNKDGSDNYYYQQEQRITKDLGISPERYWNNRQMFDDFYYVAGGYEKDSPEDDTIETARAVFGYEEFAKYAAELKNIKADKDPKTGEPISGTKYPKVQAYIDSLDIPDIEKKILYTMQYPNYKKYKGEIVKYLDQNDNISYYSFYKILEELDYKVDNNGRVTWY